ncbi:hypothetical protein JTE90_029070 [Oedothorax gibbosus]|uniref:Uncharacterized protein n=1 Tax=Oedothorax gibbosus TaxID=931172 RepID=A0AAV6UUH7_9ARAC|nr:hypothetical protein JTE90_029070 [Oedothorax gibbosus]
MKDIHIGKSSMGIFKMAKRNGSNIRMFRWSWWERTDWWSFDLDRTVCNSVRRSGLWSHRYSVDPNSGLGMNSAWTSCAECWYEETTCSSEVPVLYMKFASESRVH